MRSTSNSRFRSVLPLTCFFQSICISYRIGNEFIEMLAKKWFVCDWKPKLNKGKTCAFSSTCGRHQIQGLCLCDRICYYFQSTCRSYRIGNGFIETSDKKWLLTCDHFPCLNLLLGFVSGNVEPLWGVGQILVLNGEIFGQQGAVTSR